MAASFSRIRPAYQPSSVRRAQQTRLVSAAIVSFTTLLFIGWMALLHNPKQAAPVAIVIPKQTKPIKLDPTPVSDPLASLPADMTNAMLPYADLSAAASFISLDTGKEYDTANASQNYEAASTAKLATVFYYMHQVELGKATLTQNIGGDSAQDNIQRMIVQSDNDAWAAMNTYLKMHNQQSYLNSLGLKNVIFQQNDIQFSSSQMAVLLQLLYNGKLMNESNRQVVYGYMAHTTVTNLIQAALPSEATVYHKYGQIDGVLHDAAIVGYQNHHFVLVVYTNNSQGTNSKYNEQVNLTHAVTQAAFSDVTQ